MLNNKRHPINGSKWYHNHLTPANAPNQLFGLLPWTRALDEAIEGNSLLESVYRQEAATKGERKKKKNN
jgi:hypothetical protein